MTKLTSTLVVVALTLLIGVGAYVFYLWATYIDRAVDAGQAYGLSIGDTKRETFGKLALAFEQIGDGQAIFTEVQGDSAVAAELGVSPGRLVMVRPNLDASGFGVLSTRDQWTFYVGPTHRDLLRLSFCNEKLCRIYRHRKYFELP